MARVEETTNVRHGKWVGSQNSWSTTGEIVDDEGGRNGRSSEKIVVPSFTGEGGEADLGTSARSYLRKVEAWTRCSKMAVADRAVALCSHLGGKAWVMAEELDMDILAGPEGLGYFTDWIRVRFMEMEVTKVGNVMTELFKKCRRRAEQSVRDFNVDFERMMLRLKELDCELPDLVKAWLYLDKLKLSDSEELSLLSSVHNRYDVKLLQQAAILHDQEAMGKGKPVETR